MQVRFFSVIIFLLLFHIANAQTITGLVTDIMGKPLIGANVIWENTKSGTVTDSSGNFSIQDKLDGNRILKISYVGFTTERLDVKSISHWEVQLIEDATLSEVNITAKGSATRFANDVAKVEVLGVREIQTREWRGLVLPPGGIASPEAQGTHSKDGLPLLAIQTALASSSASPAKTRSNPENQSRHALRTQAL